MIWVLVGILGWRKASCSAAFGDGVTGVVRNAVIKKRSKSPIGNVFMFIVSALC